jgi:hypothetical protein
MLCGMLQATFELILHHSRQRTIALNPITMKQTMLLVVLAILFSLDHGSLIAQVEPAFVSKAFHTDNNASFTEFEVKTSLDEVKIMIEQLEKCGTYIHASYIKTEQGYLISLRIEEQTGPEYVAKLMMVLGVTHYTWNNERKDIAQLEADLLQH